MAVDDAVQINGVWCYLRDSMGPSYGSANDKQKHNAEVFYNVLRTFGYSHSAAAGVLGNMQTESGLSPAALSGNVAVLPNNGEHFEDLTNAVMLLWNSNNSSGAHATGLVQWDGTTAQTPAGNQIVSFAIRYGHAWLDWVVQLFRIQMEYIYDPWGWGGVNGTTYRFWYYLDANHQYQNTITWANYLVFSGTPEDAADHWRINFERSSTDPSGIQHRRDNARYWYDYFNGYQVKEELPLVMNADMGYLFRDSGYTYSQYDCIGFTNLVRRRLGLSTIGDHGGHYGTNTLWRDTTGDLLWKGTLQEAYAKFGALPDGCYLFKCYPEGTPGYDTIPAYYYGDGVGNFDHIGIYTNLGKGVMQSGGYDVTPPDGFNGVHDTRTRLNESPPWWTHVAIPKNFYLSNFALGQFKAWMTPLFKRKKVLGRERKFF